MGKDTIKSLSSLSNDELEKIMKNGTCPRLESLVGWEFNGYNTPYFTKILGIKKFKKGFIKHPKKDVRDRLLGYNVKIEQNRIEDGWIEKRCVNDPIRFGWYHVYPARKDPMYNTYKNSLLINYNCKRNFALDPTKMLRDYIVQVSPSNEDILLGRAFLAMPLKSSISVSYFILEKSNEVSADEVLGIK